MTDLLNLQNAVLLAAIGAVVVGVAGALLGTHLGVNRWRMTTFLRALASVLWIATGKLILTGK